MSLVFDKSECPAAPTPLQTDTLVDSVLILLAMNVVQRIVGFVRAVLFCRWLDADQLGVWDMAFSFLLLAAPLSVLAIPGAFGRYLEHFRQRGQLRAFLQRTILACGGLAIVACTIIVLLRQWLSAIVFGSEDQAEMIGLAAGTLVFVISYNFLVELFTALRNVRFASTMQLINSVAFAALGIGLLVGWKKSAESVLISYGGSCLIAAIPAVFVLRRICKSAPLPEQILPRGVLWSRLAPYVAWVLMGSVLMNLFNVVDRYMLLHFSQLPSDKALDAVGNYYAARVVPLLLISIATMLATMITPHLSHDWEAGRRDLVAAKLRLFLKVFGFALFAAAAVVLMLGPLMFEIGFRGKFPQGLAVLPWTLLSCTWFGLWLISQNYLFCAEKARLASVALATGLAIDIPLNLLLLPSMGLQGAVLSAAAANAVSLWLVWHFNRRLGFQPDNGVRLVLALPILLCGGRWLAILAIPVVAACAVWGNQLLTSDEKRQLAEGLGNSGRRFGLKRWLAIPDRSDGASAITTSQDSE
jgi:polysaccharide transporter, PST family